MLNDLARARRRLAEPVVDVSGPPGARTAQGRPSPPQVTAGSLADIPFDNAAEAPEAVVVPRKVAGRLLAHRLYDLLVYRRIRATLGGRVRYAISGGSALDPT